MIVLHAKTEDKNVILTAYMLYSLSCLSHPPFLSSRTWGSLKSNVNEPSMRHAGRLFRQQQVSGSTDPDKEREPLLVKQVEEDDGRIVNVVVGQSTLPQTIFNSVNVLIGVGLLALPLAMRYSGWIHRTGRPAAVQWRRCCRLALQTASPSGGIASLP